MKLFKDIPEVRKVTIQQISDNYYQISQDIQNLIDQEICKLKAHEEEVENE